MTNIDKARERLRKWNEENGRGLVTPNWDITTVLDALDAAERDRDEAVHARMVERRDSNVTHQERNELAAVIEKAIAYVRVSWLGNGEPTRDTPAGEIIAILESAPTDALRHVKAKAWDEGQQAEAEAQFQDAGYGNVQHPDNPYRIEKGEQTDGQ